MGSKSAKAPDPLKSSQSAMKIYETELLGAIPVQEKALALQAEAEKRLTQPMTAARVGSLGTVGQGLLGLYGQLQPGADQFQQQYAAQQLSMMAGFAPTATQAVIGGMDATTRGLYQTFGQQALSDLQMGTALSEQERTLATQTARAAAEARGLNLSRQGTDLEILGTYQLGQQRQAERRQAALQAFQLGQGVQTLGMQGFLTPAYQGAQAFSLPALVGTSGQMFGGLSEGFVTAESQYLADLRSNIIAGQNAVAAANAQRSGAIGGAAIGAVGSIAAKAIGLCWVAREVYGDESSEWLIFRSWLVNEAPEWLRDLYCQEGERFALFISDKPWLKSAVRGLMNLVVQPRKKNFCIA